MLEFLRNLISPKRAPKRYAVTVDEAMAKVRSMAVPNARLVHGNAPSFSKLGGNPNLPQDTSWPTWNGQPLAFLAQISLKELQASAPLDWLPAAGNLLFFYVEDQSTWGFDPKDIGSWRVVFDPTGAACPEVSPPANLSDMGLFNEVFLRTEPALSLPDPNRVGIKYNEVEEIFWERVEEVRDSGSTAHQIGGFPFAIQNDYMELECQLASNGVYCGNADGYNSDAATALKDGADNWRLLMQIDSDDEASMMWGDVGRLYFWIKQSDLDALDFSKVWMVLQCY